jgi:hypothetical protein
VIKSLGLLDFQIINGEPRVWSCPCCGVIREFRHTYEGQIAYCFRCWKQYDPKVMMEVFTLLGNEALPFGETLNRWTDIE